MRHIVSATIVASALMAGLAVTQDADKEKTINLRELPAAVQQAINEQSQGSTLRGLTTELEGGKTVYEAELRVDGHSKDVTFDAQGHVVSLEEETTLDKIPAPARLAIQTAAGKAKVLMVETVTEGGTTAYEAQLKDGRRASEVKVDAAGHTVK